jgi:hypothetical protein
VTEREIDELLAAWTNRLAFAAQNLVDLRAHATYQRLLQTTNLTGLTAEMLTPVLEGMGTLFEHYDILRRVIAHAEKLRAEMSSYFVNDQRMREIEFVLRGRSIRLPPVQIPIGQRSLFSAVENVELISPNDLLSAISQAFDKARNAVMAVDQAWKLLHSATDDARLEIAELRKTGAGTNELAAAEAALDPLLQKLDTDPLGAQQEFDSIVKPTLEGIRQSTQQAMRDQQQIEDGFRAAHVRFDELLQSHAQSVAAHQDAILKLTDCDALQSPQPEETVEYLRTWLDRLQQKYREGLRKPMLVGLRNWNKAADSFVSQDRDAMEANANLLSQRSELRGRLDALRAKARAQGHAETAALLEVGQQARDLLYSRPTPLKRAADLVLRYEGLLSGRKGTT